MPNLRGEGLPLDVKSGANVYVVGPLSVRPDGGFYRPTCGVLGEASLPVLRTGFPAPVAPPAATAKVPEGRRHDWLRRQGLEMARTASSPEALHDALLGMARSRCRNPGSVPEREVWGIAGWAWEKRCQNSLWGGANSTFHIDRLAMELLAGAANHSDAVALYIAISRQHGHIPGKTFALVYSGMCEAMLINMSEKRFRAARNTLVGRGLLELAEKHRAGTRHQQFRLLSPLLAKRARKH